MTARGKTLESRLTAQHRLYRAARVAKIDKCHPEARVVSGRLTYTDRGPPDYMGCLAGGRGVVFEAKETKLKRWPFKDLADHQARSLGEYSHLGFRSFIVIMFMGHAATRLVMWEDIRDKWWSWRGGEGGAASIHMDDEIMTPLDGVDWLALWGDDEQLQGRIP